MMDVAFPEIPPPTFPATNVASRDYDRVVLAWDIFKGSTTATTRIHLGAAAVMAAVLKLAKELP